VFHPSGSYQSRLTAVSGFRAFDYLACKHQTMFYLVRVWLLCFLFFVLAADVSAQQKWPNTFLWRISGNGLTKPSYLYGTIHLQDKRLFQFTDSLYKSLESVEGFALEVDMHEFMDSLFAQTLQDAEDRMPEKQKVQIDKKKIDKSTDSVLKKLGIKADGMTRKDLKKIRDYRMNKLVQQGEMQTIVDGYLYGLALRHGKWTGGIEDVMDQLSIMDEMGGELSPDQVFQPEINLRRSLEEMIKSYINHDLQGIADFADATYDKGFRDVLLTHRNIKMARRMDSLAHIRTMFFAVGVAHLPGDSGVITLLRNHGFKVEPVFSSQSIAPETYTAKLSQLPWKKVDDNAFSIEMPGVPSDYNVFGAIMKMKMFFDLPTMTFYMAGHALGGYKNAEEMGKALQAMAERMGGIGKVKPKDISNGNLKGMEGNFDIPSGGYRVRLLQNKNSIFILMAGSSKKANLKNQEADRFFSSFTTKDQEIDSRKLATFNVPGKGIMVELPGKPNANKMIDRQSTGTEWRFFTYDLADEQKGIYYMVQVRDIMPGYYLEGDSTYFSSYKTDMLNKFDKLISEEQFQYKGWPAFKLVFANEQEVLFHIFGIVRASRVYSIIAGGQKGADFSDLERIFNSVSLQDYTPKEWKTYQFDGFRTMAPAEFTKLDPDSTEDGADYREHIVSYDSSEVMSYEVFKGVLSPYFWTKNDSSFFEAKLQQYKGYQDSILKKEFTYNGKLRSMDALIERRGNNTLRRIRFLVNGDTLYTLALFFPKQYLERKDLDHFFQDFRLNRELPPVIYSNKSKELFEALKTKDSTAFDKLSGIFNNVSFAKEDLPVLHKALTEKYLNTDDYFSMNERIADEIVGLEDPSTVQFVAENYSKLKGEKSRFKYTLLYLLAIQHTKESYDLLKQLLLTDLPEKGTSDRLSYALRDSLQLTRALYPEIVSLASDSTFAEALVSVSNKLFDSSLLSVDIFKRYERQFLQQALKNLQVMKSEKEDQDLWWTYADWAPFIARFNDKESNDVLYRFLALPSLDAKHDAAIALFKNEQPVPSVEITKLAADNRFRSELYEELKKINKSKIFPAKYATQLKIGESDVYEAGTDDYEPSSVSFIAERVIDFMGKKEKFYLFKVTYDDEETSYLGIAGPYPPNSKEIFTNRDATGIYWEEQYDKTKLDQQFKAWLASVEQSQKEEKESKKD
jgi:uncharacterized protein YbaP (TraB family)